MNGVTLCTITTMNIQEYIWLSVIMPKESKVHQSLFDYYFVYLNDYLQARDTVLESLVKFPEDVLLVHRKMFALFALNKTKQSIEVLMDLIQLEAFDRELTEEYQPAMLDVPEVIEMIKS